MKSLKIDLKNCYGINNLEHIFDFTNNKSIQLIYAPNGIMKTSFANTLNDYSKDESSSDRVTPDLVTTRCILDENNLPIPKESIFVIKSYEKSFKSTMVSTLLVNQDLKNEYERASERIHTELEKFKMMIGKKAGLRKAASEKFCEAFGMKENSIIDILLNISSDLEDKSNSIFSHLQYNKIFDPKIVALIKTSDFQNHISEYIRKYDVLIKDSKLFNKDFNHFNALTVQKQLKENGYFNANHSVLLELDGEKKEFNDANILLQEIVTAQEEIFENEALKEIFDKIDKKLTSAQLRGFRDLLLDNQFLLKELRDLDTLKRKLWLSYILNNLEQYNLVLKEYKDGQEIIQEVLKKAQEERTSWENVIEIFNSRFYVPYKLEMENKVDTIVKEEAPSIKYFFNDSQNSIDEELLWRVLSQGEKRTLYLLNIIFEIEARKSKGIKTLLIIDDIADSFDYKNKYAIVEYLKEISMYENFFLLILTHNFDFMRTIQDRVSSGSSRYQASYIAMKEVESIILEKVEYKYISNPLNSWKRNLIDPIKLIASITFARNLAEYIGDRDNFKRLTSLMHLKGDTKELTVQNIEEIYKTIFNDMNELDLPNKEDKVYDIIMRVANKIVTEAVQNINLENKIAISIAIRLRAEEYMINKINNEALTSGIKKNQMGELLKIYKELPDNDLHSLEILERVNIMTPENIHLNSFMFEPILDLSNDHLISLFKDIDGLTEDVHTVNSRANV